MRQLVPRFLQKMVLGIHLSNEVFVKYISSLFLRKISSPVLCPIKFRGPRIVVPA